MRTWKFHKWLDRKPRRFQLRFMMTFTAACLLWCIMSGMSWATHHWWSFPSFLVAFSIMITLWHSKATWEKDKEDRRLEYIRRSLYEKISHQDSNLNGSEIQKTDKASKLERLMNGAATPGEREAARLAIERVNRGK